MNYPLKEERLYFNYNGQIPPVKFDSSVAEIPEPSSHNHPKLITDTTMRDGAQDPDFAIFPNETKLKYFDLLHELDNGTGVIESVEVFIYQKRDIWTLEKLLERGYDYPRVTTWTRATSKDIRNLVNISGGRISETGMLASSSDHHIFDRLSFRSRAEAMERYLSPILTACENGIIPRVHLEDATRADIYGWVLPFVARVLKETDNKAIFRICDTMGLGVPDPRADLPTGIPKLISTIYQASGAELEFHGHNDFGNATANSLAALRYGCKKVNTAFAGLGERTGNASLEQVLANYIREYGNPGLKIELLTEMADLIRTEVVPLCEKRPIIGSKIFATQAGLHQTGISRQDEAPGGLIYLPFDPAVVGNRQTELNLIGALSGMDGMASVLNQSTEAPEQAYSNVSKAVKKVYDRVHAAYDGEYISEEDRYINYRCDFYSPEELMNLAKQIENDS